MNGVHDMGGAQGFGPVAEEPNEPVFHHDWERRVFGMAIAMGYSGQWNLDQVRFARESTPPSKYLASTYYQVWFEGLKRLLLERGLVTAAETADGKVRAPAGKVSVLASEGVEAALRNRHGTERPVSAAARFKVGDRVRTRNINPPGHTRLPRYCRAKPGTIARVQGVHVFPDSNASGAGERPQWVYSVRFEAKDLWGGDTTAGAVYVDCFEPCLEAA